MTSRIPLRTALALAALATITGCGAASNSESGSLAAACTRERAALADIGRIETLGDAGAALRAVIRIERRALARVRSDTRTGSPLATQLELAIAASSRSLASIEGSDPQQTMSPIRTGTPAARRATVAAGRLLTALCGQARA